MHATCFNTENKTRKGKDGNGYHIWKFKVVFIVISRFIWIHNENIKQCNINKI